MEDNGFSRNKTHQATNSTRRSADEANVVDIMNALYKLDLQDDGPMFYVSPKCIGRLPRFNPEPQRSCNGSTASRDG